MNQFLLYWAPVCLRKNDVASSGYIYTYMNIFGIGLFFVEIELMFLMNNQCNGKAGGLSLSKYMTIYGNIYKQNTYYFTRILPNFISAQNY